MPNEPVHPTADSPESAFQRGQRAGLATAALALSLVSFLNLLGAEKSVLAIVLAVLALRGSKPMPTVRDRAWIAVSIAAAHVATVLIALVVFRSELREFIELLQTLG